jgi:molecular chaperone Hsp33
MRQASPFGDYVQPFQIEAPGLRGRLVRLGSAVDAVLTPHHYPAPVAAILAEALAMSAVLASGLKYDGVFTVQVQGDGPVGLMIVDVTSDGGIRGYARFDAERLRASGPEPENPVPRLLGAGHMAFTVDQGPNTERYQALPRWKVRHSAIAPTPISASPSRWKRRSPFAPRTGPCRVPIRARRH